ncbi:hypothetical protein AcV5_001574 [Taiwanofungus camphoratus]|nr:hypothetical protein AcV5_001574 [Antrodia cinnamomea]
MVAAVVLTGQKSAIGARAARSATFEVLHTRRQDVQTADGTATTSSINWWPYPSWGATTTSGSLGAFAGTSAVPTISGADLPIVTASASSPTVTTTVMSTSVSIIRITALPPANSSSSSQNQLDTTIHRSSFDVAYLAPLFAVLGILAGALIAWVLVRWFFGHHHSHCREVSLEPGPRYAPPPDMEIEDESSGRSSNKLSWHGSAFSQWANKGSWIARAFSSSRKHEHVLTAEVVPAQSVLCPVRTHHENIYSTEDTPFLVQGHSPSTENPLFSSTGSGTRQSGAQLTAVFMSPDPLSAFNDEEDTVPYDTLRHKSIRRGILERLKFGTMRRSPAEVARGEHDLEDTPTSFDPTLTRNAGYRQGHKRKDSDFNVDELRQPAKAYTPMPTPTRERSLAHRPEVDTPLLSGTGFRIIEEDTEAGVELADGTHLEWNRMAGGSQEETSQTKTSSEASAWGWNIPWSSPTKRSTAAADDNFTAVPTRRSTAEKKSSPFSTPAASRSSTSTTSTPAAMTRVDSSVLPLSPPRIMSPPLESKLFFGPIPPDFGSSPSLHLQMPGESGKGPSTSISESTPGAKVRNKLRTQKEPPPLPFPSSSSSSPYRARLKKLTKGSQVPPKHNKDVPHVIQEVDLFSPLSESSRSPVRTAGHRTPAERQNARHSALDKVDEIISRSWTLRNMSDIP